MATDQQQPIAPFAEGILPAAPPSMPLDFPWLPRSIALDVLTTAEVAGCTCPDCEAPMAIRMWLRLADCWRCGTSIELTEEILRDLQRQQPRAAVAPVQQPAPPVEAPAPPSTEAPPELATRVAPNRNKTRPPPIPGNERRAAADSPTRTRRKIGEMASRGTVRVWCYERLREVPGYLVSFVLHLVALLLLAFLTLSAQLDEPPTITLSTTVDRPVREGEQVQIATDEPKFDLPIDPKTLPPTKEARLKLQQDSIDLRLDADAEMPLAQPIGSVRDAVKSSDPERRALAMRDPRIRAEVASKEGGTTLTEAAVTRGLRWLASQQQTDGSWNAGSSSAGTSLALLPFLGAGQTHLVGKYQPQVAKGLKFMLSQQKPDGDLRGNSGGHGMYVHGQATIVLCEAYKMTGDEKLRDPAQRAVDFVVKAQHVGGGWRYVPAFENPGQVPDTSVTGWQVMALFSGKAAYLNVPDSAFPLAGFYLDSAQGTASGRRGMETISYGSQGGLYGYVKGQAPTPQMTAEALLSRMFLGWKLDHAGMQEGVGWLLENHLPDQGGPNLYYWYYGTQVMHHVGGKAWNRWNTSIRDRLVSLQTPDGSWPENICPHGGSAGRVYTTSLSTATLEVYYRHAPLFRQIDLE